MKFVGIDIGGTGIKAGIVNEFGEIIVKRDCVTDSKAGFDKVMQDIFNLVMSLLDESHLTMQEIGSIGVGIPSFINQKGEVTCVNLGWHQVNIVDKLKEMFPTVNTYVENDATVAAIAESHFGSMKGHPIAVMLTLGTGVGGGIIINGIPFTGAHGMASEIGHVVIGENYFNCNCGNNGCFETFCSATAIIKYAQHLLAENKNTSIYDKCEGKLETITAKMVFDAYREEDKIAKQIIQRFKSYLAIGIAGIINTLDPHIIAIGGGVSKSSDIILDGLDTEIRKHILYKNEKFADIVVATLGNDAGIIGAAFLGEKR